MEKFLKTGFRALGLSEKSDASIPDLIRYAELLIEKNKVMNLTAITEPEEIAALHFLDSIALLNLSDFSQKRVIDVGTGAGFPGLPLKILEPSMDLTLLDSQNKRIEFLREVCQELKMTTKITCVHGRAEDIAMNPEQRESFDIAISRAVAALPILAELCLPLVKPGGKFLAMKSLDSDEELRASERAIGLLGGQLESLETYQVPGTAIRHRLIVIEKKQETPEKYPRAYAKIKRKPL